MVTDREAKVWMVAAVAVFVWACTMVGCTSAPAPGILGTAPGISAVMSAFPGDGAAAGETAWITPVSDADPLTVTVTPDAADSAFAPLTDATQAGPFESFTALTTLAELAPARPDLIRLRVRELPGNYDAGLSGLSIAHPLLSAKRLLVAGVTQLHRLPRPVDDWAAFQVARADAQTRPIAAATATDLRTEALAPSFDAPVELAGLVLEQPAWLIQDTSSPTPPRPMPAPGLAAAMTADEAKFDSAGIIGIVLGAMVLLFGGEAVVLWMLNRHQAAAKAQLREALVADAALAVADGNEPSIFRLPEPTEDAASDAPRSRAA